MNREIANILYQNLCRLGSDDARKKQAASVARLIAQAQTRDVSGELAKEFGFASRAEFIESMFAISQRKAELNAHYNNVSAIEGKLTADAYRLVVEHSNDGSATTGGLSGGTVANSTIICPNCPFNDCNTCWPSGGGTDDKIEQESGGGGGVYSCRREAGIIRENSRMSAGSQLVAAFIACGWTAFEAGGYAGTVTLNPGVALGVGSGVIAVCDLTAMLYYGSQINIIESNYRTTLNGCTN